MIAAALATGTRQEELAGAFHLHLDRRAKRLTVVGKRNKLRVIDLEPFGGHRDFRFATGANAPLFWHGNGERYAYVAGLPSSPMSLQPQTRIFVRFRFHDCGIFTRLNGCGRGARSTRCSTA
jgi:hypothetical protein